MDKQQLQENAKALLLVAFKLPSQRRIATEHVEELGELCRTLGIEVLAKEPVLVRSIDAGLFFGSGKLEELASYLHKEQGNLVVIDDEISPAQARNLEKLFKAPVIDRTEVILEVFHQRAATKEAKLQIELARQKYFLPRLKKMWSHLSRQQGSGGGGVYLKGEGEKQIEIDRRLVRKRIAQLEEEITEVQTQRKVQRQKRLRSEIPIFSIVGYTNVGKSSLLKALTGEDVFIEDKLFATLDTTTRKMQLPSNEQVLVIDTVGFIRKLPHLLVAAFKSTLEESLYADVLIHVVDASHPMAEEQAKETLAVLKELNADNKPVIHVFNKIDAIKDPNSLTRLKMLLPNHVALSVKEKLGFDALFEWMEKELKRLRKRVSLRIPQEDYGIVTLLMNSAQIHSLSYEENDVCLIAEVPQDLIGKVTPFMVENDTSL